MSICEVCPVRPSATAHSFAMHGSFGSMLWLKERVACKAVAHGAVLWLHSPVAPVQTMRFCVIDKTWILVAQT